MHVITKPVRSHATTTRFESAAAGAVNPTTDIDLASHRIDCVGPTKISSAIRFIMTTPRCGSTTALAEVVDDEMANQIDDVSLALLQIDVVAP